MEVAFSGEVPAALWPSPGTLGPLMGGPLCRVSILRNVSIFVNSCRLKKSQMSPVKSKERSVSGGCHVLYVFEVVSIKKIKNFFFSHDNKLYVTC